jgi:hypothetical protein
MTWICLVLAWFAATVLRGRRAAFPLGAIGSGLAVLACLNLLNPDALVARVNLARAGDGGELDVALLARLSPDATPMLARELGRRPADQGCAIARAVRAGGEPDVASDWRSWNVGRARAAPALREMAQRCGAPAGAATAPDLTAR